MNRDVMFGALLVTGMVLAVETPRAERAEPQANQAAGQARAGESQIPADAGPAQPADAQPHGEQPQTPPAEEPAQTGGDGKLTSVAGGKALGMSILGNQEAPTSLVIVPWKTSELGNSSGISTLLDDSRQPVDKDVFMRSLRYYEIRSETKP
jgi:hypothetical protein